MLSPALGAVRIHPVKSLGARACDEAAVEPWGLAGDRRWMLIDSGSRVVTQRQQPRMALLSAELLPGGGLVLSAPGSPSLTVEVPDPARTVTAELHRSRVEVVSAADTAHAWFGARLGVEVRLVRRTADPSIHSSGGRARPCRSLTVSRCSSRRAPRWTRSTRWWRRGITHERGRCR